MKILFVVVVTLISTHTASAKDWHGLVPLHSTRTDVEAVLGPPIEPGRPIYKFDGDTIVVTYALGGCGTNKNWDVPRDTVTQIEVRLPSKRLTPAAVFRELQMTEKQFSRYSDPSAAAAVRYEAYDEGVFINSLIDGGCERVISVEYGPSDHDNGLRCPDSLKPGSGRCVEFQIIDPDDPILADSQITFGIGMRGTPPDSRFTYKWAVSAGRITAGQGTGTITIDTTTLASQSLNVTLEIGNLPPGCPTRASSTVKVLKRQ